MCGPAEDHTGCKLCGGVGVVSDATAERWRKGGRVTRTSSTILVADTVKAFLEILRPRGDFRSRELYAEGRMLVLEMASWNINSVPREVADEVYGRAGTWQRAVEKHLLPKEP